MAVGLENLRHLILTKSFKEAIEFNSKVLNPIVARNIQKELDRNTDIQNFAMKDLKEDIENFLIEKNYLSGILDAYATSQFFLARKVSL